MKILSKGSENITVRSLCYKCDLINLGSKELLASDATHSSAEKALMKPC